MKLKNKKKSIVAFLSLASLSIIYPISNINNKEVNTNDSIANNKELLSLNNKKEDILQSNSTIFTNRYTQPIISHNSDNPGFLGASSSGETIYWNGTSFFNEWSANLVDHPNRPGLFSRPVLVTAIHSESFGDEGNNNQNLIFTISRNANTGGNEQSGYIVLIYDAITGDPITPVNPGDDNKSILVGLVNAPILSDGSVMTLTFDPQNNRFVYYYIDDTRNIANDIGYFSYNPANGLFDTQTFDFFDNWNLPDNVLLNTEVADKQDAVLFSLSGLSSASTFKGMVAIFYDSDNGLIIPVAFNSNLHAVVNGDGVWRARNINNDDIVWSTGHPASIFQKVYEPFIRIDYTLENFEFKMNTFIPNFSSVGVQVSPTIFEIGFALQATTEGGWTFDGTLLSGDKIGFSTTDLLHMDDTYQQISVWYDQNSSNEYQRATVVYKESGVNYRGYNLISDRPINSGNNKPTITNLNSMIINESNEFDNHKLIAIGSNYYDNSYYLWSVNLSSNNNNVIYKYKYVEGNPQNLTAYSTLPNGFLALGDVQERANQLGITNSEGAITTNNFTNTNLTVGPISDNDALFTFPNEAINFNATIAPIELIRNVLEGSIVGSLWIEFNLPTNNGNTITLKSKIHFSIEGFKPGTPSGETKLEHVNSVNSILPFELLASNVENYFSFNIPTSSIISWIFSEQNNITGVATISVTTDHYFDPTGLVVDAEKTFTLVIESFRKIEPTSFVQNSNVPQLNPNNVNNENISNYIRSAGLPPDTSVGYSIVDKDPLTGIIDVTVNVNKYYDSTNGQLLGSKDFILKLEGFQTTAATTIVALEESNDAYNTQVNTIQLDTLVRYYVVLNNPMPETTITASNMSIFQNTGTITATITIDKHYDSRGFEAGGVSQDITFSGFTTGLAPLNTRLLFIPSDNNKKIFPEQITNETLSNYVNVVSAPSDANITYNITSKNNISQSEFGGSIDVQVTVNPYLDQTGSKISSTLTINATFQGFKSVIGETEIITSQGSMLQYPQYAEEASSYITAKNKSDIPGKITQIIINKIDHNNLLGNLVIAYTLENSFNSQGQFVSKTQNNLITITGFKRAVGITRLTKKTNVKLREINPSDFNINIENWDSTFRITNAYQIENSTTTVGSIQKKSYDNSLGRVTLEVGFNNGFFDSKGNIVFAPGETVEFIVTGFKVSTVPVETDDNLFIIIGASVGGLLFLIILIAIIISIINKKKHNKLDKRSNILEPSNNMSPPYPGIGMPEPPNSRAEIPQPPNSRAGIPQPPNSRAGIPQPPNPRAGIPQPPNPRAGVSNSHGVSNSGNRPQPPKR